MFLNIIGNNYKALGDNYEASHNYNMAYKTVPSRIYPLYLLVKLYDEIGDKEQVIFYANKINEQKDKIKSPATVEMRGEVKKILEKYN